MKLNGLKVLDLTGMMADHGAEVIKIESALRRARVIHSH